MFLNSSGYDAVIATESSLIRINKQLEEQNKDPLYLIYPVDGVAVNDSPFAYLDYGQDKKENFLLLQSFLLGLDEQLALEKLGKRTWYGGVNAKADASTFNKKWGIDTNVYLNATKYPSKDVINDAIIFYIDALRKPSAVAFCLDFSGSMSGDGEKQLKEAMDYILDFEKAKEEFIQFSTHDRIYVLPFAGDVKNKWKTYDGRDTNVLISNINLLTPSGGTNIYGCAELALALLSENGKEYTKTVILMTDGESNGGSYQSLENVYRVYPGIPIYSIMFGSAKETQLKDIATLTNAKVFDGRTNLIRAFKEVRSYN